MQAAWAWSGGEPMCTAASGWAFADGSSSIAAGSSAAMICSSSGANETVTCPASTGTGGTAGDPEWWDPCGFGDSCAVQKEIMGTATCGTASGSAFRAGFSAFSMTVALAVVAAFA